MIKFVDANVFIERWSNPKALDLTNNLNRDEHCTSVLVLTEVFHKLNSRRIMNAFHYIRDIMGAITVYESTQKDLFNAMKNPNSININDKIHIEVMKRNNIQTIISYDKDFDSDKTIIRIEP